MAPIVQEIKDRPQQEGHEDQYCKSYKLPSQRSLGDRNTDFFWIGRLRQLILYNLELHGSEAPGEVFFSTLQYQPTHLFTETVKRWTSLTN